MSRPTFFVRHRGRLAARLKHLLYGWRFARQIDGRVIMHWPDEMPEALQRFDGAMYSASLIFDLQNFYREGGTQSLVFMGERTGAAARRWESQGPSLAEAQHAPMRPDRFSRDLFKKEGLVFYETQLMRYQLEDERKSRAQINRELGSLFAELPTTPYIEGVLQRARGRLGDGSYVGLHVRRGDVYERLRNDLPGFVQGTIKPDRLDLLISQYVTMTSPQTLFEPFVAQAIESGKKIAYFSDSPDSIKGFLSRFGASNIIDAAEFQTRLPIQKAYLDFVLLKDAEQIVSTRSSYAGFSAELGGKKHVIVSAAHTTLLPHADVVDLYYEEAARAFLPTQRLDRAQSMKLREVIANAYSKANRLPDGLGRQIAEVANSREVLAAPEQSKPRSLFARVLANLKPRRNVSTT